ncbi:MAG: sigma 54-interacting transcriptional regulator, partial [Hydrogenophaga sp.]
GIVMFGQVIPELEEVKGLLNIDIRQHAYQNREEAGAAFDALRTAGFDCIVGSSLVVEMAELAGMKGLLAYSLGSIRRGFEDALELARVARLESARYDQLDSVLQNLHEAVLAVDTQDAIIAINPPMQALLAGGEPVAVGTALEALAPELSLRATVRAGETERGVVQRFLGRDWVVNRSPIREGQQVVGAALTLQDAHSIHEADNRLRMQQRRRQTQARHRFADIQGRDPVFQDTVDRARRYAATDLGVLIAGESGTGKELFAQAIHNESARHNRPFVAVNCAAFTESLLESELFGYEEGAFTGARKGGQRGVFEAAHTGTLFLDEIGDMPMTLQTRLLRVLQEREITRVGATSAIPVDVRIVVATHQDLQAMVDRNAFRRDLYFRINALRLQLPPLRERPGDVADLTEALLRRALERLGRPDALQPLGADALAALQRHPWPGNVRELENVCQRIAVCLMQMPPGEALPYATLATECAEVFGASEAQPPRSWRNGRETPAPAGQAGRAARARHALEQHRGHHGHAAQSLGVSRTTFWRWLRG